jgi:hypothetical protein
VHSQTRNHNRPHKDRHREYHEALCRSFLAFAERRGRASSLMKLIRGADTSSKVAPLPNTPASAKLEVPSPVLTPEALKNNPITTDTRYVMHLTTRHDFGPVISHRYFVCPPNLEQDWLEVTLVQWFAKGEPFRLKAEKWDLKCPEDSRFYRLILRPNLALRSVSLTIGNK